LLAPRKWKHGPPIYPADELLEWLERQTPEIVIRLPVFVTLKPNRMYLESATIGDKPDALAIKVNDTGMALPIAGKWNQLCSETVGSSMLLLRGTWRGGPTKEFQVSSIEKAILEADRVTHAEVAICD
jgi:hypothetical protein